MGWRTMGAVMALAAGMSGCEGQAPAASSAPGEAAAAAERPEPSIGGGAAGAQVKQAVAGLTHPDGRLKKFGTQETYEHLRVLDAAAGAGYADEVYELGKSWKRDRRRSETPEEQNAVYASDAMFEIASRHGVGEATLELARKQMYWGVHYEELHMGPEARTEFDHARTSLQLAAEQGDAKVKQTAARLMREVD